MEPKAVLKSTKAQYNLFLFFSFCEMIEFKTNIASMVSYPGIKPNRASYIALTHCDHFYNF